jgi:hypothetical protein
MWEVLQSIVGMARMHAIQQHAHVKATLVGCMLSNQGMGNRNWRVRLAGLLCIVARTCSKAPLAWPVAAHNCSGGCNACTRVGNARKRSNNSHAPNPIESHRLTAPHLSLTLTSLMSNQLPMSALPPPSRDTIAPISPRWATRSARMICDVATTINPAITIRGQPWRHRGFNRGATDRDVPNPRPTQLCVEQNGHHGGRGRRLK